LKRKAVGGRRKKERREKERKKKEKGVQLSSWVPDKVS
jgi:hypothetical protein